jgi:hypothetical protein
VVQAFGSDPLAPRREGRLGSLVFRSQVGQPHHQARLLSADPSVPLARSAQQRFGGPGQGESIYGPRIGRRAVTSHITQVDSDLILFRDELPIARTGGNSPGGAVIHTVMPAVINGGGLTFFQLVTDRGLELCVHDGLRPALLLQRGDLVDGRPLDTVALGFHTTQADNLGRLVCYGQFADGQEAVLLGIPV